MPNENENEKKQEKQTPPPADQNKKEEPKAKTVDDFIEIAKKQKDNTVEKTEYDKVVAERNRLMESILEGKNPLLENGKSEKVDIAKLKERMRDPDISNLEFVKTSLQLRQIAIENGEEDPYLPKGAPEVTEAERQRVEEIAKSLQKCVDESHGSDTIFRGLLDNAMVKDDPTIINRLRKSGYKI